METITVLVFAVSLILGEAQYHQGSGSTSCNEICCSISQNVGSVGEKVTNLAEKVSSLEAKLLNAEKEILELRSLTAAKPQVAFSAALRDSGSGDIGPFNVATSLKYKRLFANVGSSYNPATGIFTAIVRGMYFFRYSMFNNLNPVPNSVLSLKKNGELLVSVWDVSGTDSNDMGSNAVVVALDVGDTVYVELHPNRVVYDDGMNYNTFTGFLLFPM